MLDLSLDLRFLRCALSAAEHGSFRRAAAVLDLPQSTISRRIKLLEHRLGFSLFVRDRRGVRPTVAGSDFPKQAVIGARQLESAVQLAAGIDRGDRGELRVGIFASWAGGFLHILLQRFGELNQGVSVALSESTLHDAIHAVAMGESGVSFVSGEPKILGHESLILWYESIYVVLPPSHELAKRESVTWEDLRGEVFIVSRGGSGADIQDYLIRKPSCPGVRP